MTSVAGYRDAADMLRVEVAFDSDGAGLSGT